MRNRFHISYCTTCVSGELVGDRLSGRIIGRLRAGYDFIQSLKGVLRSRCRGFLDVCLSLLYETVCEIEDIEASGETSRAATKILCNVVDLSDDKSWLGRGERNSG